MTLKALLVLSLTLTQDREASWIILFPGFPQAFIWNGRPGPGRHSRSLSQRAGHSHLTHARIMGRCKPLEDWHEIHRYKWQPQVSVCNGEVDWWPRGQALVFPCPLPLTIYLVSEGLGLQKRWSYLSILLTWPRFRTGSPNIAWIASWCMWTKMGQSPHLKRNEPTFATCSWRKESSEMSWCTTINARLLFIVQRRVVSCVKDNADCWHPESTDILPFPLAVPWNLSPECQKKHWLENKIECVQSLQ